MDLSPDEDNFQGRILHQAALWDNVELLQELLAGGADVDARDARRRTALHAAALADRSRCLQALCDAGADVNAKADAAAGGETALHIAAERGHVENIRVLLRAGADPACADAAGDSPLALAERHSRRHAAHALREHRDALERERLSQHAGLRELVTRGEVQQLRSRLAALGASAELVVNMTPGGANTLLYVASESGLTSAVTALLDAGADGRAHPVTRYGPLYAACYHGHLEIARILLSHFPRAVQQETVEKWLPLHAACIGGHAAIVTLLLSYPYPEEVLNTYTDESGQWQYKAAFDVNALDARGQSALYVACTLGSLAVVEALLQHEVPAERLPAPEHAAQTQPQPEPAQRQDSASRVLSPQRGGISLGIHAIVSKLTGAAANKDSSSSIHRVRPVCVERRGGSGGDSCVARAVVADNARLLRRLLDAGASADAPAPHPPQQGAWETSRDGRRRSRSASAANTLQRGCSADRDLPWTALAAAARAKNARMVEMLVEAGASDPHCLALRECARHGLADLLAKLLATKAYPDPDYKLNKSSVSETVFSSREGDAALTYSALCPTTPVMVNWRELRCQLAAIRMSWLRLAALRVNARLSSERGALLALTRIDLANNDLRALPPDLFTLVSLRYLNAAQNKLERLPRLGDPIEDEPRRGRKKRTRPEVYSAPVLQDLYLQDNRLEELPPELFRLPSLTTLDVSNNKLRVLPASVWCAPALKDLNAALNHLRDLPAGDEVSGEGSPVVSPSTSSPQLSTDQSTSVDQSTDAEASKHSSRSPSIERSDGSLEDGDAPVVVSNRAGNAVWSSPRRPHAWRGDVDIAEAAPAGDPSAGSRLAALNLAHNQFTCVPAALACRAPRLHRLNMAYNSLRSMSYVTSYPTSLRQLDLSHNEITCWPSLPQIESFGSTEGDPLACYCPNSSTVRTRPRSGGSVRSQLLSAACPARRHLRLEGLRTLILANNLLTRIQLTTDDDGLAAADPRQPASDDEWGSGSSLKSRLLFPLLSMLDVSCNLLRAIPPAIHELTNLSVLNISGNKDITELPPTMGLLSRLWNLSASGCALGEPLRSMLRGGRYRSADVVGYLKSVLQEARPYTNMKLMLVGMQGIGKTSLLECLRQESAIQHRRKPTDHWAKRMGNKSGRRGNLSTVGVDIGTWVYEKHRSTRGPVTFRTWDFGGQQEYYATHQYFLSRRSLYLVLWRAVDGRRGLAAALDWLRSIQARAPGSPVIMVATHYDQVGNCNLPESESPQALQRLIRCSIMGAPDADKRGLPRVLDSLEVSCSTRHNIRLLADIIYSVAFSVKPPGSKEPLLEQLVPASYLALEDCVTSLAHELREPVLRHHDYRRLVTQYMQSKNLRMFRDAAELHQATMFLHENGVLLHYDDATLKELYFLRPQWLCDVLAHVVTVREVNPFAAAGIMRTEDLAHVFKASPLLGGEEACGLGAMLLNKFELALSWDARVLLVPPLLPAREPATPQLALRSRSWGAGRAWPPAAPQLTPMPDQRGDSPALVAEPARGICISARAGWSPLRRLLLVSYVPRGFWPRLCTRVLADAALAAAAARLYRLPPELEVDEAVSKALELNWGWKLWKTGMRLCAGDLTLVSLRELPPRRDDLLPPPAAPDPDDEEEDLYHTIKFSVRSEGALWTLDPAMWACVELLLPAQTAVLRHAADTPVAGCQSISLEPNPETLAKALALVSDHVDLLLEDWYPSLGTRFVHTSEGRCLITRLVPCPLCLRDAEQRRNEPDHEHDHDRDDHEAGHEQQLAQAFRRLELGNVEPRLRRPSQDSRDDDGDSGVGPESNASSRVGSVEGMVNGGGPPATQAWTAAAWAVEECILAACTSQPLSCRHHGPLPLRDMAPDTLLLDVEEEKRARWEHITRGGVAGRGAFGTVLLATWRRPPPARALPVALKALQPVQPPPASDISKHHAYKAALSRWERDPVAGACRAYCGLRQELAVLQLLRHAHVVPLVAICAQPLALLLALAPQGALDAVLRTYAGTGVRVGVRAARALALQLAKALEYLHASRVLYRDLKSENVLVWAMPKPQEAAAAELSHAPVDVHVKLGDYGISRLAPPSGTKGFGGTEGFMAPEIMRYNGEEEYNEKVDCFSFGMLVYEVLSLRQPFEGHEAVKEAVLEGARPALTTRELEYPCNLLETMRRCWSGSPQLRPSAAALVSALAAPEATALADAAACRPAAAAAAAPCLPDPRAATGEECGGWEVWYGGEPDRAHALAASRTRFTHHHSLRLPPDKGAPAAVTAMCRVGGKLWLGDSAGRVSVYNASSMSCAWSVRVQDAVGGGASAVSALLALPLLHRVALALRCGRLFLVTSQRPEAEGSFVLTELGTATELCCLAAVPTPNGFEVWAGGDGLTAYGVSAGGVSAADAVLAEPRVTLLAAHAREPIVIAYSQPGTHVYQYSAATRQQTARLDCSKLAPCSESLHSIAIDDAHADRCQVTALCVLGSCVYAGTAAGCILVADAATLRPLTVFRPYESNVTCIVPLVGHEGAPGPAMLATFGDTYRPLLNRFQPQLAQQNNNSTTITNGFYCLLWRAHHWLPD